jgi:hypothetical protein
MIIIFCVCLFVLLVLIQAATRRRLSNIVTNIISAGCSGFGLLEWTNEHEENIIGTSSGENTTTTTRMSIKMKFKKGSHSGLYKSTMKSSPGISSGDHCPKPLVDFAQFIPMRLTERERALLNVLESTLQVSEYTDNVDVSSRRGVSKTKRILDGILEANHIATGLAACGGLDNVVSTGPSSGSRSNVAGRTIKYSLASRSPSGNSKFFRELFEVGRRNKVLNPSKMRDTYGKLMYLLQDAQSPPVAQTLGFSLYKDLVLVGPYLETALGETRAMAFLDDPRLESAVLYVDGYHADSGQKMIAEDVRTMIQLKQQAADDLVKDYAISNNHEEGGHESDNEKKQEQEDPISPHGLSEEEVRRCVDSIADAVAVCASNMKPVQRMLQFLEANFHPTEKKNGGKFSNLTLRASGGGGYSSNSRYYGFSGFSSGSGSSGPTLSHSHSTQYTFVWQSLKLWHEVQKNMHQLWVCADADLLSTHTSYSLWNTGQGLNRVQSCPRVGKMMHHFLSKTQQAAGAAWVGLSVIHLGDRDVPNALIFIDKYTQIPRFLKPLVDFIDGIEDMCESNEGISQYVENEFGSPEQLKMMVLCDYFKHGFDGSGDDGGSCIDGRLTSSWNWTSRIVKKPYYHSFMLSGFQGFDGDFK